MDKKKKIDIKDINLEVDIINLTPHAIDIIVGDITIEIPPSGTVARVKGTCRTYDWFQGSHGEDTICIPLTQTSYGGNSNSIVNLPEPSEGKVYVVSALTAQHCRDLGRQDIFVPTGTIRDCNGQIIGCSSLGHI